MRVLKTAKKRLAWLVGVGLVAVLFAAAGLFAIDSLVKAQGSVHITGTITSPGGTGVQNVEVTATAPDDSTVLYGPATTDASGAYDLGIDPGTYDIHFTPATGSGLNPTVVQDFVVSGNEVLSLQLTHVTRIFSGTLRNASGNPVPNAFINMSRIGGSGGGQDITDANGLFSMTAPVGEYRISGTMTAGSNPSSTGLPSKFQFNSIETESGTIINLTGGDVTQDLQLPETATLTVVAQDIDGSPMANVPVSINGSGSGQAPLIPGNPAEFRISAGLQSSQPTNASGETSITVFKNLVFSSNSICASFLLSQGGQVCSTASVSTENGNATVTITRNEVNTFSGTVRDANSNPVPNVRIMMSRIGGAGGGQDQTDANGMFSITVPSGEYRISGLLNNGTNPPPPGLPSSFQFSSNDGSPTFDLTANSVTQDLQLPETATLTVIVQDTNGNAVSDIPVSVDPGGGSFALVPGNPAEFRISAGLRSSQTIPTNSLGEASVTVFNNLGFSSNSICAIFTLSEGGRTCNTTPANTENGGVTVTLTKNEFNTFSGTIRDANSSPVPDVRIFMSRIGGSGGGQDITDANGFFSIPVPVGEYRISGAFVHGTNPNLPTRFGFNSIETDSGTIFDLTTNDVTQDLQLPETATLTVITLDVNGDPLPDIPVSLQGGSGLAPLVPSNPAEFRISAGQESSQPTNSAGEVSITVFKNLGFSPNSICARFPLSQGGPTCNAARVNTENGNATVVFQQAPPVPDAPTNLVAVTPTNEAPNLTWGAVSGAEEYRIFREGNQIGTSTQTSFTDTEVSASGDYSYTVAAVNSNEVVGPTSEPFVVVYDIDAPTITYTLDPSANTQGWNNSGVTVTFTCDDALSGVATCSEPVTVSVETDGQEITGTATDEAGNTANVTATVKLDKTAPTINYELSTQPNTNNWHNTDVTITFTCDDALSGIASCPDPITLITEGPDQVITGTATDNAGNTTTVDVTLNIDKTASTITYTLDPAPNAAGWNNSDTTVTFDCQDSISGVESCTNPSVVTTEGDSNQVTGTVTDLAGNTATTTATVKLDKTNPTIGTPTMSGVVLGILLGSITDISATVGGNLSGVVRAEYYFDTDPGQGNGTTMNLSANPTTNGTASATANVSGLGGGQHTLYVRAQDDAGNWSTVASRTFLRLF